MSDFELDERDLQHANVGNSVDCINQNREKVNCIQTTRDMMSVFVLAQRNTQHAHMRKDIECINMYRERISTSIHTELWCLLSCLQNENDSIHT